MNDPADRFLMSNPVVPLGDDRSPEENFPNDDCPISEWVAAFCDGTLEDRQCIEFEDHLSDCLTCTGLVDTLTSASDATLRMLSALPAVEDDEPEFRRLKALLMATQPDATIARPPQRRLADPPVGSLPFLLGNYELLECIGRGAWGAVYRARHTKLDQPVAVKVLDTKRLSSELAVDRFLQEAKAAGQLRHPNIVRATDAGQEQGLHYLAMELIEGVDAACLLRSSRPLRVADACELVRQAAEALDFAHRQSWVHRDVKPSNLMVTYGGQVQLLDLGIAGKHGAQNEGLEHPLGTAEYMAPEQWSQSTKADARADVYSLGCTLYKLLTGRTPASDCGAPTLLAERDDVTRRLDQLVTRMISQSAESRISTASEVAVALRKPARGADLAAIAIRAAPLTNEQRSELSQRVAKSRSSSAISKPTRRKLLVAGSIAGVCAVTLPWALRSRSPRLDRSRWRTLKPPTPAVWFEASAESPCLVEQTSDLQLRITAEHLSLVQLGRAIAGPFSLRVAIRQEQWPGGVGLFYRGSRSLRDGYRFQMIEVRPADDPATPLLRRLLWTDWIAPPESKNASPIRTPLAEATVDLQPDSDQLLEATVGRRGCPAVRWNGAELLKGAWLLSSAGRRQAEVSPTRAQQECVGYLGLVGRGGVTEFKNPELAYVS